MSLSRRIHFRNRITRRLLHILIHGLWRTLSDRCEFIFVWYGPPSSPPEQSCKTNRNSCDTTYNRPSDPRFTGRTFGAAAAAACTCDWRPRSRRVPRNTLGICRILLGSLGARYVQQIAILKPIPERVIKEDTKTRIRSAVVGSTLINTVSNIRTVHGCNVVASRSGS